MNIVDLSEDITEAGKHEGVDTFPYILLCHSNNQTIHKKT